MDCEINRATRLCNWFRECGRNLISGAAAPSRSPCTAGNLSVIFKDEHPDGPWLTLTKLA